MLIVEMGWGRPHTLVVYGNQDGVMVPEQVLKDPDPDPEYRSLDCRDEVWEAAFHLAIENGWKPLGPIFENPKYRPTGQSKPASYADYEPFDWVCPKQITAEDALGWADALSIALEKYKHGENGLPSIRPTNIISSSATVDPQKVYSTLSLEFIQAFITFLRKGPFRYAYDD